MRLLLSFLAGGALLPVCGIAVAQGDGDVGRPEVLEAFVDGLVPPLMRSHDSPSGAVAITRNGRIVLAKGFGYQDIGRNVPVDAYRTLFRPGSVSKLFTWVAVMQLVERGRLDLDADVNSYLTTFRIREAFDRPVTLRAIMTHTPGFEDGGMGYLIIDDPARALPLREAMARYQPARVNPPGVQTAYSNYGAALAGLIVSNVSGMPFTEYVRRNILDPLGMRDSTFVEPLSPRLAAHMAKAYAAEGGAYVAKPFEIIISFAPAGAMSSSVTDMARFALAILNGGEYGGRRILQEGTVETMLTRQFSHDPRMMGMALGFYETERNGIRLLGHDGDTGWFHSELVLDREHDLAYFVTFSAAGGGTVRSAFKTAFYNRFFPRAEAPPRPPRGFGTRADRYAGSYWFWRSNFSGIEKAFGMADEFEVAPTANDTLAISIGGAVKQYVEIDTNLFRELDPNLTFGDGTSPRLIAFQEGDGGRIKGFVMDEMPFMSLRKKAAFESFAVQKALVTISLLVFSGVLLRAFYQRRSLALLPAEDRASLRAAACASAANVLVLLAAAWVMHSVVGRLRVEIPLSFKLTLILPMVAGVAGAYLLYRTVLVWRHAQLAGLFARLRYTAVTCCASFMFWFYYYWNILGFQLPP